MIPEKIANAWVTSVRLDSGNLFGFQNGKIEIVYQQNGKADIETVYKAVLQALSEHFKSGQA